MSFSETKYERHPSYGLVEFSRCTGGKNHLFGSPVEHHNTIRLTISAGEVKWDLGKSWYFGYKQYIEVELSPAQFGELLTTMNSGPGVCCTIRRFDGKQMPECPFIDERKLVEKDFEDKVKEITSRLITLSKQAIKIIEQKDWKKSDREELKALIVEIVQDIRANIPFVQSNFNEANERIVNAYKAEVDAFLTNLMHKLGAEQLREQFGIQQLENKKD